LFRGEGIFCSVCNWVEFEDKGKKFGNMGKYMARTTMLGSKLTYFDYLSKFETPKFKQLFDDAQFVLPDPVEDEIDTDELYSIVFVYARGESAYNQLKSAVGPGGAFIAGTVIGGTAIAITLYAATVTVVPTVIASTGFYSSFALATVSTVAGLSGLTSAFNQIIQDAPEWMTMTVLIKHDKESLEKLGCQQYQTTKK